MIFIQFFWLQNYPPFPVTEKLDCFAQLSFQDVFWERSMTLLLRLIPTRFSEVSYFGIIRVFHEFIKHPRIPAIESKKYVRSNLRKIINGLGELEDNRLKNDHPLCVPLPSTNFVKFYIQDYHKYLPDFTGWCAIALGRHTSGFSYPACHLLSSVIPPSKWYPRLWCTQSW